MPKSKTIRVTPNVMKCLKELKSAVRNLPSGDVKKRAKGALDYLSDTFEGKPQPGRGYKCPVRTLIIR